MNFLLVDISTILYRVRYAVREPDRELAKADCVSFVFNNILRSYQQFGIDHVVMAFDAKSWRYSMFPDYKGNRKPTNKKEEIVKEDVKDLRDLLYEYFNAFTACSTIRVDGAEADDVIAHWVLEHPTDKHIIMSGDSDFRQLIDTNVSIYDPKEDVLYEHDNVFYRDLLRPAPGQRVVERYGSKWKVRYVKKNKLPTDAEEVINPGLSLFVKIMKGDRSDNIPSAVPPRFATTKIEAAFNDPSGQLFEDILNLSRDDVEFALTVRPLFERNLALISLRDIPQNVRDDIAAECEVQRLKTIPRTLTANFLKLCSRLDIPALSTRASVISGMLAARLEKRSSQVA